MPETAPEELRSSPGRLAARHEYPRREPENDDRSAYVPTDAAARINLQHCADAGKKVKSASPWPRRPASQTYPELLAHSPRPGQLQSPQPVWVSVLLLQWMESSGFRRASVSRSSSSSSVSSKTGSDTTYFSLAQAPRSSRRQRSLQNGKFLSSSESVALLQIGQRCFMTESYPKTRSAAPVVMRWSFSCAGI